jgi:hypothetical protein
MRAACAAAVFERGVTGIGGFGVLARLAATHGNRAGADREGGDGNGYGTKQSGHRASV